MTELVNALYIVASILFIYGLRMLGNQKTARRGNIVSSLGMLIAIVAALTSAKIVHWEYIVVAVVLGSFVGVIASQRVAMTAMPEMVALFNGFGGIASLFVGWAEFYKILKSPTGIEGAETFTLVVIGLAILVGAVTFTGSLIAYGKLSGKISSKPVLFSGQQIINAIVIILILTAIVFLSLNMILPAPVLIYIIVGLSLLYGIMFVIPIGGGDMPVVISLLNSFSGVAACITGFVISNNVLIVAGALVGSSGLILTQIMTKAMNRRLGNVLFSGFGATSKSGSQEDLGEPNPINVEDAYYILEAASNVLIVPGYGMAVAQAQHVVRELAGILEENGAEVNYAIHPVAGRMPGHMNVLLAEANVDYDQLREMDDVNPTIEQVDLAIIIGANDVVNPAAREDETSVIYGMPIIDVDKARTTIVLKRSMSPGYAGIENPLFYKDNTRMLFGDAKKSVQGLITEFKN